MEATYIQFYNVAAHPRHTLTPTNLVYIHHLQNKALVTSAGGGCTVTACLVGPSIVTELTLQQASCGSLLGPPTGKIKRD